MCALEIERNLEFQYSTWRIQRIGWVCIGLTLCSGLMGLFGHHPLAITTEETADSRLSIEYSRYTRYESHADIRVKLTAQDNDSIQIIRLWFDDAYLDALTIVAVSPVPLWGESRNGQRAFVFQSEAQQFTATFRVQPQTSGIVRGTIRADNGDVLPITHFVWP